MMAHWLFILIGCPLARATAWLRDLRSSRPDHCFARTFWCILWLALAGCNCLGQETADGTPDKPGKSGALDAKLTELVHAARFEQRSSAGVSTTTGPAARVDLGPLMAGREYQLRLKLENPDDEPIVFQRVAGSCGCGKIMLKSHVFPGNSVSEVLIRLDVPSQQRVNEYALSFSFLDAGDREAAMISVRLSLAGNLMLDSPSSVFQVRPRGVSEFVIPIVLSSPVEPANLEVTGSGSLDDVLFSIRQGDGAELVMLVAAQAVGNGLPGTVRVRDRLTGVSASMDVLFTTVPPVVISPGMVRFSATREMPETAAANVLFRISPIDAEDENPAAAVAPPDLQSVSCSLGNSPADLELTGLGRGVYRAVVQVPVERLGDDKSVLRWEFRVTGRDPILMTTPVFAFDREEWP